MAEPPLPNPPIYFLYLYIISPEFIYDIFLLILPGLLSILLICLWTPLAQTSLSLYIYIYIHTLYIYIYIRIYTCWSAPPSRPRACRSWLLLLLSLLSSLSLVVVVVLLLLLLLLLLLSVLSMFDYFIQTNKLLFSTTLQINSLFILYKITY